MVTTVPGNDVALPRGAALLSAPEQDQVAGGMSVYYNLFYWVGEHLGFAERAREDWLIASNDAADLIS